MSKSKVPVIGFMIRINDNKSKVRTGAKWTCDNGSTIKIKTIQSVDTSKGYIEIVGTCSEVTKKD